MSLDPQDAAPTPAEEPAIAPTPSSADPAVTGPGQGPLAYSIGLGVILADQLSKLWVLYSLELPKLGSVPVLGPFKLTMVWNQGVSFGLLRADNGFMRWLLVLFSLVVAVIIAVMVRKVQRPLLGWAFGLVMGGAIGNMIDRARLGAVADFLDFQALHFPWVFNIADSAITIGVVLLLVDTFLSDRREKAGS